MSGYGLFSSFPLAQPQAHLKNAARGSDRCKGLLCNYPARAVSRRPSVRFSPSHRKPNVFLLGFTSSQTVSMPNVWALVFDQPLSRTRNAIKKRRLRRGRESTLWLLKKHTYEYLLYDCAL